MRSRTGRSTRCGSPWRAGCRARPPGTGAPRYRARCPACTGSAARTGGTPSPRSGRRRTRPGRPGGGLDPADLDRLVHADRDRGRGGVAGWSLPWVRSKTLASIGIMLLRSAMPCARRSPRRNSAHTAWRAARRPCAGRPPADAADHEEQRDEVMQAAPVAASPTYISARLRPPPFADAGRRTPDAGHRTPDTGRRPNRRRGRRRRHRRRPGLRRPARLDCWSRCPTTRGAARAAGSVDHHARPSTAQRCPTIRP
jgi:hypothetical protein